MSNIKRRKENYNRNYMIVAIDIGQKKNSAIFRSPYGKDSQIFEFSNTKYGFDRFGNSIIWFKNKYNAKKMVVCFEPTGVYGEPLIHYLDSKKIPMVQVNPVNSKKARELRDNSPNKTDKKDPRVIADLVQLNCYLSVIIPKGDAAELRQLLHARERAIGFQNRCINELHALITKLFPEFFQLNKSVKSKTAQYLLQNCIDPERVVDVDIEKLISEVKKISRGQCGRGKVYKYQELAKDTVGVREGKKAILKEIKFLVVTLVEKTKCVEEFERDISEILRRVPFAENIMSIKGIGEITTAAILGETAIFQNMRLSQEVEKLAGYNLFEISSGKHRGQKRISKRGRSLLRKMLYFGALNVIKHDGVFKERYQVHLSKGMPKNQALVAIARKLLRVIFALVRDDVYFEEEYQQRQVIPKAA